MVRYNEVKAFIEGNKRRPSKYTPEERNAWNWLRHTQKQYGSGELKAESSCIAAESRNLGTTEGPKDGIKLRWINGSTEHSFAGITDPGIHGITD